MDNTIVTIVIALAACSSGKSIPHVDMVTIEQATVRVNKVGCDLDKESLETLAKVKDGKILGWTERPAPFVRVVDDNVSTFRIDKYPIDCGQRKACISAGYCRDSGTLLCSGPVVQMTYPEAEELCRWRNARLPTYTEWQRAIRGINSRKSTFPADSGFHRNGICKPHARSVIRFGRTCEITSPEGIVTYTDDDNEWVAEQPCDNLEKPLKIYINMSDGEFDNYTVSFSGEEELQFRCVTQ